MYIIFAKASISIVLALIVYGVRYTKLNVYLRSKNSFLLVFIATRVVPFLLIYIVANQNVSSDVPFFFNYATHTLAGKLVYRDFWQPYSPLFSYLNAFILLLWNNPKAIIVAMLAGELLAVLVTRRLFNNPDYLYQNIYLLLPVSFVNAVLASQEDVLLWLFFALFLIYVVKKKLLLSACIYIMGILTTKIIFMFPLVLIFFLKKGRNRLVASFVAVGTITIAILLAIFGETITSPLKIGSLPFTPNLISVLNPIVNFSMDSWPTLNWLLLVVCLVLTVIIFAKLKNPVSDMSLKLYLTTGFIIFYILLIIIHKNSLPNYWYIVSLPISFFFFESFNKKETVVFLLLNVIAAVQPSLWYNLGAEWYTSFSRMSSLQTFEYLLEILYIISSVYIMRAVLKVYRNRSVVLPNFS